MASSVPPEVTLDENGDLGRLRVRIWQITLSIITVLATVWFITLGALPGIIAVAVAKHVLVAILAMGLGVDHTRRQAPPSPG